MTKVKINSCIWGLELNRYVYILFCGKQIIFVIRYSKFHIWPLKYKVKVMDKVKPDGHIRSLLINRYVCLLFLGNRTILGSDMANFTFDVENSRSTTKIDQNQIR